MTSNSPTPKQHARLIHTQIQAIGSSKGKMYAAMQAASFLALEHANIYGNATPMLAVANAINETGLTGIMQRLNRWLASYGPVRVNTTGQKCGMLSAKAKAYRPFDLDQAAINPFYTMDADAKTTYYRPSKFVKLLLEGAEKQVTAAREKAGTTLAAPDDVFERIVKRMGDVFTPEFLHTLVIDEDKFIALDKLNTDAQE